MEPDWYEVLGVPPHASGEEVKAAYRALALRHHPDRNPDDPRAARRLASINAAYEVLGDRELRRAYDEERSRRLEPQPPPPAASARRPPAPAPPSADAPKPSGGLTGQQAAGRLIAWLGAALAARGFLGAFVAPRAPALERWLGMAGGQDRAFLLYFAGMAVVFVGFGVLLRR